MLRHPHGFVLIEVILASALFLLLVVALGGALLYGQETSSLAGNRTRAVFLADEGLEAVRNIRDEDFTQLSNGTYGLTEAGGAWALSSSADVTDIFSRTITIDDAAPGVKTVTAVVTWQQNAQRTGEVTVMTRLSDWTVPLPPLPLPGP